MVSSGRRRRWLAGVVVGGGGLVALACGSSNEPAAFDSSDAGGGAGTTDGAAPHRDSSAPVATTDSSTPSTTPDSSLTGGDDGAAASVSDASWSFDGFARADGFSEASYCPDDDGDGFTVCAGDCNDHDSLVNPCAFDTNVASGDPVGADGLDNDCDGTVDNRRACDAALTASQDADPAHYAAAMDLCNAGPSQCGWVVSAAWVGTSDARARRITQHMGNTFVPHQGSYMAFLSSGIADDDKDLASYRPGDGTNLNNMGTHPDPLTAAQNTNECGQGSDESTVPINDYIELDLQLRAPLNAGSFSFDFNFFSEEYPRYVCAGFNDTFLAMLTSAQYPTTAYKNGFQIAFDAQGHRVNVNNGFFTDCPSVTPGNPAGIQYTHTCAANSLARLNGTGYEVGYSGNYSVGSGATDWLKTTAPIKAGEVFTVRFVIFDEEDHILDSAINLDNFRWGSASLPNPVTGR